MSDAQAIYAARGLRFEALRAQEERRSARLSIARLVVFLLGAASVALVASGGGAARPAAVAAVLCAVAFFLLVVRHERVEERVTWFDLHRRLCREHEARLRRDWDALPEPPSPSVPPEHPHARDLGVVGRASLFHLLGGLPSANGRPRLASWLTTPTPPPPGGLRLRQQAVTELAPLLDLRDELAVRGRLLGPDLPESRGGFLAWAEAPPEPWGRERIARLALVVLYPTAFFALFAMHLGGVLHRPWWILLVLAVWMAVLGWERKAARLISRILPDPGLFKHYPGMIGLVRSLEPSSELLRDLLHMLDAEEAGAGAGADRALARLHRWTELANVRLSTLGHFTAQRLFLWDFIVLEGLERWRERHGSRVRGWLDALGEIEALSALASLRHDHPAWCMAEVAGPEADTLEAPGLAHPLLAPAVAVANDVTVGPPGRFLLVTGSNMSGKSTLLRAIGLNVVLAQAGGPACARSLRLPPLEVRAAIRIEDSLEQGVSYFLAELRRLKTIVTAAERTEGPRVLYLLDEILQGTNSAERQIAARRVLARLLATGAIGAASTHDLALADTPALAPATDAVHFRETVRDGAMTFDYTLHPGIATSVNALRLMGLVGL